jgi:hypothetical protein
MNSPVAPSVSGAGKGVKMPRLTSAILLASALTLLKVPHSLAEDNPPLTPFGIPGDGARIGPRTSFEGSTFNAMQIVLVCDTADAAASTADAFRARSKDFIDRLKPFQAFNVMLSADEKPTYFSKQNELAVPDMKRAGAAFLDAKPSGKRPNHELAIRYAIACKPQVIILALAGDAGGAQPIVKRFRDARSRGEAVDVYTLSLNPKPGELDVVLQQIAKENNGEFHRFDPDKATTKPAGAGAATRPSK